MIMIRSQCDQACLLSRLPDAAGQKIGAAAVNRIGKELFPYYLEIRMADTLAQSAYRREEKIADIRGVEQCFYKILRDGECVSLKEMAVTGKDLIGAGIKPGPQMGEILNTLLEECWKTQRKSKAYLLERALNVYEEK